MRTKTILLCLLSFPAFAGPALDSVEAGLQSLIDDGDARAIVIGLYDNGKTSVAGFGQLSRDNDASPKADTIFEIGSITKVFTTLLAEEQASAERLAWSDTLGMHLPDVEFASDAVADITIAELAGHTSGLPRMPNNMPMDDPMDPYAGYDSAMLQAFIGALEPVSLDKSFAYSNLGMGLLGEIASSAADLSYEEAMQRDVLSQFDMADTSVRITDPERLARGFSGGADMANWSGFDALAGAGAVLSTTRDLLSFVDANLNDDNAALESLRQRASSAENSFGWITEKHNDGDTIYWHNGGTGGYASFLGLRPESGTGVVILSASTNTGKITELGMAQIKGEELTVEEGDLGPYTGTYQLAPGLMLAVFEDDGRLMGQATGQGAFPLTKSGEHEFSFEAASIRIVFNAGEQGFDSMNFYQGGSTTAAPRVADDQGPRRYTAIDVEAGSLADLVGGYLLAPGLVITITANDAQLYAQLTGQPAFPVFAYEPDKFFFKVVDAQLIFERDEAGAVSGVILNQNGQQRAPRID
ncbi:MAG: serine hydrolase [Woeseiaceae bacterium]|nr:serine hydrolase [Woeseiaceae bacterium]